MAIGFTLEHGKHRIPDKISSSGIDENQVIKNKKLPTFRLATKSAVSRRVN
jgi:hypothetical protein